MIFGIKGFEWKYNRLFLRSLQKFCSIKIGKGLIESFTKHNLVWAIFDSCKLRPDYQESALYSFSRVIVYSLAFLFKPISNKSDVFYCGCE